MPPKTILLFSGKRKSGKDYLTDNLVTQFGEDQCVILKISQPIKSHWAKKKSLDLEKLLSDGKYKEQYRLEMIQWSEEMRSKDYGCFCRIACQNAADRSIWIVSDVRRRSDIKWFKENYHKLVKTVRVTADDETRITRGFVFTPGVDDAESECDLDTVSDWDFIIDNGKDANTLNYQLTDILTKVLENSS